MAFIGWFLLQAARESYAQVGLAEALGNVRVADVMTRDCPTVDGWLNVQNFVDEKLFRTGQRCFMVVDKGQIDGLITPHEVKTSGAREVAIHYPLPISCGHYKNCVP